MTTTYNTSVRQLQEVGPDDFRHVIGHFASGVTVVTTHHDGVDCGATVSAISSVSLEPPQLLVCLNNRNRTCWSIKESSNFAISVLSEQQENVARNFATPGGDKFKEISIMRGENNIPLIENALAYIECRVDKMFNAGTHVIFLGKVASAFAFEGRPLSYFRGGFGSFHSF